MNGVAGHSSPAASQRASASPANSASPAAVHAGRTVGNTSSGATPSSASGSAAARTGRRRESLLRMHISRLVEIKRSIDIELCHASPVAIECSHCHVAQSFRFSQYQGILGQEVIGCNEVTDARF